MRRTPVGDAAEEPTDEAILAPDQVQDIAMRRTDLAVRAARSSAAPPTRPRASSSAPQEAGQTFIAHVVGYNGAFHADPYVIRRTDAPAANLPDCPARPLTSGFQIPFPSVPASTKALYLVDPGRMAARDGAAATQSMLTELEALAAETDGLVTRSRTPGSQPRRLRGLGPEPVLAREGERGRRPDQRGRRRRARAGERPARAPLGRHDRPDEVIRRPGSRT